MAIFHHPPQPFIGGKQPVGPKRDFPLEQPVSDPPFRYGGPVAVMAAIIAIAQPNPWVYTEIGGRYGAQPYGPRQLNPAITAVPVNDPPFDSRSNDIVAEIVQIAQPPIWNYAFVGGRQPYEPRPVHPVFEAVQVDDPPFTSPGRNPALTAEIAALNQPTTWPYVSFGVGQPYSPKNLSPGIPGQSADPPPPDARGIAINATLVNLNQPPVWTYTFIGGFQPYEPAPLAPAEEDAPPPLPGAGKKPGYPSYVPQPAYDAKPNKPLFRPVWDRPKAAPVEEVVAPALPPGPPPLPPASLFANAQTQAMPPVAAAPPFGLPTFDELVPPNAADLGKRMKDAQDTSDAIAVLRALGLFEG